MTDRQRQRRLHVENRMAELNAKYGPVEVDVPDWLDHYPEEQLPSPDAPEASPERATATPAENPTTDIPAAEGHASRPRGGQEFKPTHVHTPTA